MTSLQKEIAALLALAKLLFKAQRLSFDFSIESLQSIGKICQKEGVPNNDDSKQISVDRKLLALGVYLGEMVCKHVDGSAWDQEVKDIKDASITFMSDSKIWPVKKVVNCFKNGFADGDIFTYTSEIIAEENRKVALNKRKKNTKAWWQFWQ